MTQAIEWTLVIGLVGLIWVIVLAILDDNHRTHDNQRAITSPEPHNVEEPHAGAPRQSKAAA
jgi:hypothetical protein